MGEGPMALNLLISIMLGLILGAAPAKRKPEPTADTSTIDSLQQMRREDDALYRSMRGICRGC
jgi:hypothetical protein